MPPTSSVNKSKWLHYFVGAEIWLLETDELTLRMKYRQRLNEAFPEASEIADAIRRGSPEIRLLHDFGQTRNKVTLIEFRGRRYVIKQYGRSGFLKRLIYSLSSSKARKAFDNATLLETRGFSTASPVCCLESLTGSGMIRDSWFVSTFVDKNMIGDFRNPELSEIQRRILMEALSRYMLRLHSASILPLDFNVGNIFYRGKPSFYENPASPDDIEDFWLIDINRMSHDRKPGFRRAMKSFDQLGVLPEEYDYLLIPYIETRGWELGKCVAMIRRFRRRYRLVKSLKRFDFGGAFRALREK